VDGEPADAALWARVGALPDKQRHAVALRYLADLSHAEIAEAMGISEPAARRNVFEGLRRLREDA
jgi:RNA polymerase sigma factor (sigma-70 family)